MASAFDGFDPTQFWKDSDYGREEYVEPPQTAEMVASIEAELGVKLPAAYLELMQSQNGGLPRNTCFPTAELTSWAGDHVAITGISGVGRDKTYSLCGSLGSQFMQDEWRYPNWGVCICDCPSGGHDMVMLDYRECGPQGEPAVVHVDQASDFEVTFLAKDFETFIRGLVNDSVYATSAEDLKARSAEALKASLRMILAGRLSTALTALLAIAGEPDLGPTLRAICHKLAVEKGYFALHNDELSLLVYDLLFHLTAASGVIAGREKYLSGYPDLLVFGDGEFKTGGYAPGFVSGWLDDRIQRGEIVGVKAGSLRFSDAYQRALARRLTEFAVPPD